MVYVLRKRDATAAFSCGCESLRKVVLTRTESTEDQFIQHLQISTLSALFGICNFSGANCLSTTQR